MSSIRTANAHRAFEYDSGNTPIGLVARQRYAGPKRPSVSTYSSLVSVVVVS